jgi:hypothetical protein
VLSFAAVGQPWPAIQIDTPRAAVRATPQELPP